jgi:type II secretory pathway component PulM
MGNAILDAAVVIFLVLALVYWVFIAPGRSRRQRLQELNASKTTVMHAWDPRVYGGRRNR